ncbi:hypothetical protein, partial [Methylobacterium gregans]|uniref:hypothetical protein n=1 Tax=Methylobacterium gregans TaxID=374424 RepID=UPI0024E0E789
MPRFGGRFLPRLSPPGLAAAGFLYLHLPRKDCGGATIRALTLHRQFEHPVEGLDDAGIEAVLAR